MVNKTFLPLSHFSPIYEIDPKNKEATTGNMIWMSYDNLSSVSQNVLKFYQQLTSEERRVPFIFGRNIQ
jgi:hypothetical protein